MRRLLLSVLVLCGSASTSSAREIGPEDVARLAQGVVLVELHADRDHAQRLWAAEDIEASPETVWAVMTDCKQALAYVPRLKSCEVVETGPDGRWDVRRHELASIPLLPDVRATFRLDYDRPRAMRFHQIAGDMSGSEGEWRLVPLDGGRRTRVIYEARLRAPALAPASLVGALISHDAPTALEGLRRLSLARRSAP